MLTLCFIYARLPQESFIYDNIARMSTDSLMDKSLESRISAYYLMGKYLAYSMRVQFVFTNQVSYTGKTAMAFSSTINRRGGTAYFFRRSFDLERIDRQVIIYLAGNRNLVAYQVYDSECGRGQMVDRRKSMLTQETSLSASLT